MAVSRAEVERIAGLARLRLSPPEADRLARDLSRVLDHVEALTALDVSSVSGVGDMTDWSIPLDREDQPDAPVRPPGDGAPAWEDGFFVVPRLPALDADDGDRDDVEVRDSGDRGGHATESPDIRGSGEGGAGSDPAP